MARFARAVFIHSGIQPGQTELQESPDVGQKLANVMPAAALEREDGIIHHR